MTPPLPTRRRDVAAPIAVISTSGLAHASIGVPWCSATQ
jgi:hypothetical protein